VAAVGHWITVAVVLLSHLHYSIDVIGAWAVTYSLYVLAEGTTSPPGRRRLVSPETGAA
jgi:hypothetical protein